MGSYVIIGASTGIGHAIAVHLAAAGHTVYGTVRSEADEQRLKETPGIAPIRLDVTDQESIRSAVAVIAEMTPTLDGLINNAGIAAGGPIELVDLDRLRHQFEVNVFGLIATTQAFLPLVRAGKGRIVNMGSISGRFASPLLGPYAASKFAVEAITDAMRVELAPWEIEVSVLEPGAIATPIWTKGSDLVQELEAELSAESVDLYRNAITATKKVIKYSARHAEPVELVVDAAHRALFDKRPKTRYVVGRRSRLQAIIARWVPDRIRDRIIRKTLGI